MQSSKISFTSSIKLVHYDEFYYQVRRLPYQLEVDFPWTAKEIVKVPKSFTHGVEDCVAGGITDGQDVVMFHICSTHPHNKDFGEIEKTIMNKLNIKSDCLQGFLLGGKRCIDSSLKLFDNFENFFKKISVPYSKFREHSLATNSSICYNSEQDQIYIVNNFINNMIGKQSSKDLLLASYCDVDISPLDEIV